MSRLNYNDTINLFSKLSFRRAWNGLKVLSSLLYKQVDEKTSSMGISCFYFF